MPQVQAPEIRQIPIEQLDLTQLPPLDTPEFETAVTSQFLMEYASRGWSALITVDTQYVRILALPENGLDPKTYVLGLLQNGFLTDALPMLEALDAMLSDVDVAYNHGLCLSELGRPAEAITLLERALALDPTHKDAAIALGVAHAKLEHYDEAAAVLSQVVQHTPDDALAKRNLAAVLMRGGKPQEALAYFRQATSLAPSDPGALLGLAQCLEELGGKAHLAEAATTYRAVRQRFADHPVSEMAETALTRMSHETMRANVGGGLRMDAVMYMQWALTRFANMSQIELGRLTMEIAMLGRDGLKVNDPAKQYRLKGLEGEFSGLELLSYMHVGVRMLDPAAETGTGLDREYDTAKAMQAGN